MKKLFIIRHAKSDWNNLSLKDFNRPLNKRGFKNAPFMGQVLKDMDVMPDLILSSPAIRAITTARLISNEIVYKKEIQTNKKIYEASLETLDNIVRSIDNKHDTVFLVGHNPSASFLAFNFCGLNEDIPTCAVIQIDFDTNTWADISLDNSKLISYDYPKKYK